MNRTGNKMHLRNTGNKHVNLIKLAHYCINDSKASCYFIAQLFILERFFANDHIRKKKVTESPDITKQSSGFLSLLPTAIILQCA